MVPGASDTLENTPKDNNASDPKPVPSSDAAPKQAPTAATAQADTPKAAAPTPAAAKPSDPKPAAPKPDAPKSDAAKPEAAKPEAAKADPVKTETPKPADPKPAAPKVEAPKPAPAKAEAPKPAPAKVEAPKPAPPKAATKAAPNPNPSFSRPLAGYAKIAPRHRIAAYSFGIVVLLPALLTSLYLAIFAQDQYISTTAFSIRSETQTSPSDLLGSIGGLGSTSSSRDADVLYQFIGSQLLVEELDRTLDLRAIYSKGRTLDPWYTFNPDSPIEDLLDYWKTVVRVNYDNSSHIISTEVHAFTPEDAQRVAKAVFDASSEMINKVSAVAREDSTRYAREDLDHAVERLKAAREAMTAFRIKTQIVDPTADIAGQVSLVNELQNQLAQALLESDLLTETARANDPRLEASARRIEVIRKRIAQERLKFGRGDAQGDLPYSTIVSEFERLTVDLEFAQETYKLAFASYDGATAEAQRQSRYLAAHEPPTLAQSSQYPHRLLIITLILVFTGMAWAIGLLIYYSMRDRH